MSQRRWNPFTRWFLVATALFLVSLVAYLGQAIAYNASHHRSLEAAFVQETRTVLQKGLILPLTTPAVSATSPIGLPAKPLARKTVVHEHWVRRKPTWIQMLTLYSLWPLSLWHR